MNTDVLVRVPLLEEHSLAPDGDAGSLRLRRRGVAPQTQIVDLFASDLLHYFRFDTPLQLVMSVAALGARQSKP